jgi:hypothetical protein
MILMAQAVPSAERLPCIDVLPLGWQVISTSVIRHRATLVLGVDDLDPLIEVILTPECPANTPDPSVRVFEGDGGCVRYSVFVPEGVEPVPSFDPGDGLSYVSRSSLAAFVEDETGLRLCGRGVACP